MQLISGEKFTAVLTMLTLQGELVWDKKTAVGVLTFVNKACDNHALAMLALCYLPGVIAAYIQVSKPALLFIIASK